MNPQDMTPAEIDAVLSDIWTRYYAVDNQADDLRTIARRLKNNGDRFGHLEDLLPRIAKIEDRAAQILCEATPFEAEYERRGRWTRYFLVDDRNGHIHDGRGCSTCRPTTRYRWLIEFADKPASELYAADAFADKVCSTCYPDAPVVKNPAAEKRTDLCNGRPVGGRRLYQKCTECDHTGSARSWRRHKPKTIAKI